MSNQEDPDSPPVSTAVPELLAEPIDRQLLSEYVSEDELIQKKYLSSYLAQSRQIADEINRLLQQQDWKQVGMLAHKFKSSSRGVGATRLGDHCEALERSCKQGGNENRDKFVDDFRNEFQRVTDYLELSL